ncbi:MAG: hypothetical protein COX62_04935 [Deltaproteobacteria bacterium CG_4_10_14_0_2_um_filter_43_8]|nr:MAG: hypothetical protein COX62_04935 [Deltaproteobacteria bacterium CG_4_10_14_0_2_um_filter_43_8]
MALALEGMASPRAMNIKGAGNVRAEHVEGEQDAAHAGTPLSKEELQDLQKRTKNDVESTLFELMDRVYDQQMMSDYKRRMAEIKKEIEIAKRSGNPALIIVALTKKVMLKKGIYMSRIGKEMALTNEKLNKIQEDLGTSTDVKDLSKAQADTRQENFSLNQLTSDFQSLVQGVASDLEFAQSTVQDYFRTSNEISRKVSGQG